MKDVKKGCKPQATRDKAMQAQTFSEKWDDLKGLAMDHETVFKWVMNNENVYNCKYSPRFNIAVRFQR